MASRENSGLHAALIVFVLITVVLAISTYTSYRSSEESEKLKFDAIRNLKTVTENGKVQGFKLAVLQYTLGWEADQTKDSIEGMLKGIPNTDPIHKVYEGYVQDMAKFGEGQDRPNYRNVPENLLVALKAKGEQVVVAVADQRKMQTDVDVVTKRETEATKTFQTARENADKMLADARNLFETDRKKLTEEKTALLKDKEDVQNKSNQDEERYKKEQKELVATSEKKDKLINDQKDKLEKQENVQNFEVADGRVIFVNQRSNTVHINLGSEDGMRPLVTFSVYDRSENSATKAKKKGGVEVTKILDEHTSEARIIDFKNSDPILPGDNIYSPIWHLGPRLHFALTGFLDIDGDGENDREMVRNMIEINGGIIDAEQDDSGKIIGKMTFQTKYLIDMHELPERAADAIRSNRNTMITASKDLGVKRMYVQEILQYMGWKGGDKTVRLGGGAAVTGPKTKKPEGDGEFRSRQPPEAGKDGAF